MCLEDGGLGPSGPCNCPCAGCNDTSHPPAPTSDGARGADLSRPQLCVSWPSGLLAVALVVWPAGNGGRWLGMVVSDTLAGYVSKEGDVDVR